MLELTTVGRKSGLPRSVMLPSPVQENEAWVIVASRGGSDRHPAWLLNLRDHPDVDVILQGKVKQQMRARIATSEERTRLWPQVTSVYKGYAEYQRKTVARFHWSCSSRRTEAASRIDRARSHRIIS